MIVQPGVARPFLKSQDLGEQLITQVCKLRIGGQVVYLQRVIFQIVQFEFRAEEKILDRSRSQLLITAAESFLPGGEN